MRELLDQVRLHMQDRPHSRRSYIEEKLLEERQALLEAEIDHEISMAYGPDVSDAMNNEKSFDERGRGYEATLRLSLLQMAARRRAIARLEELRDAEPPDPRAEATDV